MIHTLVLYAALQVCRVQSYTVATVTPPAGLAEMVYVAPSGWAVPPDPRLVVSPTLMLFGPDFHGMIVTLETDPALDVDAALNSATRHLEAVMITDDPLPTCDPNNLLRT